MLFAPGSESATHEPSQPPLTPAAAVGCNAAWPAPPSPPPHGSRRRRLWDLPGHSHCPVVGVCLPMPALRRLIGKVFGTEVHSNDYELHCAAVAECKRRNPFPEALQLVALQQASPGLVERLTLARENHELARRLLDLQRALMQAEQRAERQGLRAEEAESLLAARLRARADTDADADPDASATTAAGVPRPAPDARSWLAERAVLCVGGRMASVPVYRQVIERTGGRFLHHDGGDEDNTHKLDATLAAADLVICQTGCVSHGAYWRVKDHCKRTGKRCVFVETPSRAALERALDAAAEAATTIR